MRFMNFKLIIDSVREEIIIYAKEKTRLIEDIEKLIKESQNTLVGYNDNEIVPIDMNSVNCFFVEDNKVYALTQNEKLLIKLRLYQIEEILDDDFIKINQSCIANIKNIERFSVSFSASLKVIFKNGYSDYVSRRNLKQIKERFGIK